MSGSERPRSFLDWYRRYYLLVNLPMQFAITELVLTRVDLVHRPPFNEKDDLAKGLAKYAAHPPASDDTVMVLIGNSAVDRGLDPETIERAIGNPHLKIYNFGLKGARVDDEFGLIDHLAARGIKPRYAVLGINAYLVDPLVASDSLYPWLERRSPYVYFHRSRLRTKLWRWVQRIVGLSKKEVAPEKDDTPDATARTPESAVRAFVTQFAHRPAEEFTLIDDIPELVSSLAKRGIDTYVVILPMAATGTKRIDNFKPLMAAIRAAVPAGSLDLSDQPERFTDELFYDVGHGNGAGRVAFTQAIIPWLKTKELAR